MDTKEYERLVSLYLGSIYRVALNGCTCSSDAEDVVHLYYFEDYSVKEIAGRMKLSETAVQTRLLRARQQLKEKLKEAWK